MTNRKKILAYAVIMSLCLGCNGCKKKNNDNNYNTKYEYTEEITTEISVTEETTTEEVLTTEMIDNTTEQITTENNNTFDNFQSEKEQIKKYIDKKDFEKAKKKGKKFFINCVDFIFYGKEINGTTYDDLTDDAKKEVYNTFCTVDSWIIKIDPDYKDNISDKYSIVKKYTNEKYYNALDTIKEKIGEEKYNNIKEKKDNVKEKVNDSIDSAKKKIKEKYEIFRK